jgi:outer membrane biosynthesis protein TonB
MPILQLPPNPPRNRDSGTPGDSPAPPDPGRIQPLKLRTNRFGELEEHELIHLIDALDDERSRARFRESIYISLLVWIVIGWFLIYGPRVLFHQPVLRDPIAMMKQHDKERLTYLNTPPPPLARPPVLNQKVIQQIQKQVQTPPTPQPPVPQQAAPPPTQEQARTIAPPVQQPAIPLPAAPRPAPSVDLPSAPRPAIASNTQSAHNSLQDAMRGALSGRSGADVGAPGSSGPLQAGAQILSDVGNWDPSAYMRKLHNDIQRNWDPLIPEEVQPPLAKKGIVGIRFIILRDGEIGDVKLETASGDVALDRAAWNSIISEGQFPQLPKEYHGQQLELRVGFFYNEEMHQ